MFPTCHARSTPQTLTPNTSMQTLWTSAKAAQARQKPASTLSGVIQTLIPERMGQFLDQQFNLPVPTIPQALIYCQQRLSSLVHPVSERLTPPPGNCQNYEQNYSVVMFWTCASPRM